MKTLEDIQRRLEAVQKAVQDLRGLRDRTVKPEEWASVNARMTALIHQENTLKWVIGSD